MKANLDILKEELDSSIERFSKYRNENKKKAVSVVIASATISAITTIAIGLSSIFDNYLSLFQAVALTLSASLTILTAWDGIHNHKRLWLKQAEVLIELFDIKSDIKHLEASGKIEQDIVDDLNIRHKAVFREFHEEWKGIRTENNSQLKKP